MGPKNWVSWQNANFVKIGKLYILSSCFELFLQRPSRKPLACLDRATYQMKVKVTVIKSLFSKKVNRDFQVI